MQSGAELGKPGTPVQRAGNGAAPYAAGGGCGGGAAALAAYRPRERAS